MFDPVGIPVWVNGQPESRLPVSDRGLAYGDGLFETIRITPRGPVLLDYHLDRLMMGCKRLQIPLQRHAIESEMAAWPGMNQVGIIKLVVTRGSGGRGYGLSQDLAPTRILQHFPLPDYPSVWQTQGVRIFRCFNRLGHVPHLAGIKHLNRLEQVLARSEWHGNDEYQEGLVCDLDGLVVEGTSSNLFVVQGQQVLTPRLDQCGVAGVMRRWLIEQLCAQGMTVMETSITLDGFRVADEHFFCNSVFGVWPVAHFEDIRRSPGPVSRLAQQLIGAHWF